MGVTGPRGIVGIVRQVSKNYAVVMSLLHKNTRISAMLPRTGNFGSVQWNIENLDPRYGILTDIPKNVPVYKGDTVTTSGYSAIFPRGLVIGYVDQVRESESSNFHMIRIRFATDFRTLQYVYVIKNLNATEQHQVEAAVPHE
jgi:rod shape-determining protein MreC